MNSEANVTLPAARELARFGVRVMTIAPGIFETPMLKAMSSEVQASLGAQLANYWQYYSWQFGHDWSDQVRQFLDAHKLVEVSPQPRNGFRDSLHVRIVFSNLRHSRTHRAAQHADQNLITHKWHEQLGIDWLRHQLE